MPGASMLEVQGQKPSRAELLGMFCDAATEVVERDFHHVSESMRIDDLVIDSLGMLEIIGSLERSLRIRIPDECFAGLHTIRDLIDVVENRLA